MQSICLPIIRQIRKVSDDNRVTISDCPPFSYFGHCSSSQCHNDPYRTQICLYDKMVWKEITELIILIIIFHLLLFAGLLPELHVQKKPKSNKASFVRRFILDASQDEYKEDIFSSPAGSRVYHSQQQVEAFDFRNSTSIMIVNSSIL